MSEGGAVLLGGDVEVGDVDAAGLVHLESECERLRIESHLSSIITLMQ